MLDIDHQIEKLQAAVAVVYDCPELQTYRVCLPKPRLFWSPLTLFTQLGSMISAQCWSTVDYQDENKCIRMFRIMKGSGGRLLTLKLLRYLLKRCLVLQYPFDILSQVPEETVLTDPTGLHLGAGPYLLFYSRHLSDEQKHEPIIWPTLFSASL